MVQKTRSRVTTVDEEYYACDICGGDIADRAVLAVCALCDRDIHFNSSECCSKYDHDLEQVVCTTCWELRAEYTEVSCRCAQEVADAFRKWREDCQDHKYDNLPSDK